LGAWIMREDGVEPLMAAVESVLVPLRMGQGLDDIALAGLEAAIDSFADHWSGERLIPKQAAAIVAEIWPALDSCAALYDEAGSDLIRRVAARLTERVSRCFLEPE
jgi:hypothetical protein